MKTYKTNEIAHLTGVHPNTVRFYEDVGFITPPERGKNGYRIFTELHRKQMELARLAMRAEVLQNGLRKKAIQVVRLCAALDFERAVISAREYEAMLVHEMENAKAAIASVEDILTGKHRPGDIPLRRREAAERMGVTMDTLRNWELNGLITVKRRENGYRFYDASDLECLNIIRTLRCANYSLSAILRLMSHLKNDKTASVEKILNTPTDREDVVSVCDRLILALENTRKDAVEMTAMLTEIKGKFKTLQ